MNIKDFKELPNQNIIYGQDALHKWISLKNMDYTLKEKIRFTDYTLYDELVDKNNGLPFMVLFIASWHKPSMSLVSTLESERVVYGKTIPSIFSKYGDKINFIYVDIDKNKNLVETYNVSKVPYIYFFKIKEDNLVVMDSIVGKENVYENTKLITNAISSLLEQKFDLIYELETKYKHFKSESDDIYSLMYDDTVDEKKYESYLDSITNISKKNKIKDIKKLYDISLQEFEEELNKYLITYSKDQLIYKQIKDIKVKLLNLQSDIFIKILELKVRFLVETIKGVDIKELNNMVRDFSKENISTNRIKVLVKYLQQYK